MRPGTAGDLPLSVNDRWRIEAMLHQMRGQPASRPSASRTAMATAAETPPVASAPNLPSVDQALDAAQKPLPISQKDADFNRRFFNPVTQAQRADWIAELTKPEIATFIDDIITPAEGGAENVRYSSVKFDDFSKHPGPVLPRLSAAGLVQMTEPTWNDMAKKANLTSFGAFNQRLAAVGKLEERKVLEPLHRGALQETYDKLGPDSWAALPKGSRPRMTEEQAQRLFEEGVRQRRGE